MKVIRMDPEGPPDPLHPHQRTDRIVETRASRDSAKRPKTPAEPRALQANAILSTDHDYGHDRHQRWTRVQTAVWSSRQKSSPSAGVSRALDRGSKTLNRCDNGGICQAWLRPLVNAVWAG